MLFLIISWQDLKVQGEREKTPEVVIQVEIGEIPGMTIREEKIGAEGILIGNSGPITGIGMKLK